MNINLRVRIEIFAIGNELCYGRVYDTNSFWIADQVTKLGAIVQRITCVPDIIEEILMAMNDALNRKPHYIILTGGLGPTPDDLTIPSLSRLIGAEIAIRKDILQDIAERKGVLVNELTPNLVRMALSLKGCECFPNPVGLAPVTIIKKGETTIAALPGPPSEMRACFLKHISKRMLEKTQNRSIARRVFIKMGESQISPITDEIMKTVHGAYLKPLVGNYRRERGLPVDIITFAKDEKECRERMKKTIKKLKELVIQKGGNLEPKG